MFNHTINPILIQLGPLQVRYYGLVYVFGLILLYIYFNKITQKNKIKNFKKEDVDTFLVGIVVAIIIGARIFHVFIYNANYYLSNILEIFMIWEGGLSFHGGILFASIWIYYFSRRKNINFLEITDFLLIPVALILSLGRVANFVNAELVGITTNLSIGVNFPGYDGYRHPTQLYESAKNFIIFLVLTNIYFFKEKFFRKYVAGYITAIFLILYGFFRFLIEFLKETTPNYSPLTGQFLSLFLVATGVFLIIYIKSKK